MKIGTIIKLGLGGFFGLIALIFLLSAPYTVDTGKRGIVKTFGKVSTVVDDGLHFKMPIVQEVTIVDITTQKTHAPASAGTKDMQTVHTEVSVNYHLDGNMLDSIYKNTGLDVQTKIIDPRIQEVVKAVTAKYSAEQLITMRETVKNEIETALKVAVSQYHVVVEGTQITAFDFSDAFTSAIEEKQVAEQKALTAKNNLDRIQVEAQQRIATAQGEAEAIRIQANAIRAQGGAEYVQMKAIEKWDGSLPTYMGGNGPIPFININK